MASALLIYKDDRSKLVEWIYGDLAKVTTYDGKSLTAYLHTKDEAQIDDIDPFSVMGIFNRNSVKWEKRTQLLKIFKSKFGLKSDVPSDFGGIPTLFAQRSFFFSWNDDNDIVIHDLWVLFEKVIIGDDISSDFDRVIKNGMSPYSLTMCLYWINPDHFIGLDSRNRNYLSQFGFPGDYPKLKYEDYSNLLEQLNKKIENGELPCSSFAEISYLAWKSPVDSSRVWLWSGDANTIEKTTLRCGSSAKTIKDFRVFKSKKDLRKAYQEDVGKKDNSIPGAYWYFVKEVKEGDYVVVFDTQTNENGKQYHLLYGWGIITSECMLDEDDDNPMARMVEWNLPFLANPVKDENMGYDLFFQSTTAEQANHIKELLNIGTEKKMEQNNNTYIRQLRATKNMILTGAPGTGKTYLAKQIAMQMLGLDSIEELKTDKRFGFVQFHPSYDYTDFVEGLRPTKDVQNNLSGFVRKDGVFKEFCKHAILAESADTDVLGKINSNPKVWKVSLEGTGDNPTRTDCMENGYIRIGWCQYGDVEDFLEFEDFKDGGRNVLRAFQSGMQVGDLVVSCYSSREIDAVGVITGDYEYRHEGGNYPRYRSVKWLVKDIRENIVELNNNKTFTLSTVYKASITAEAALKIVRKYNEHQSLLPKDVDSVFVIDEINRGEISKIFGELFFSVDPGYRGTKGIVKTQYQNLIEDGDVFKDGFYVPENVYIIGTMNDIDRSVESMDFAMRRRFSWKEITSDFSQNMLDDKNAWEGNKPSQQVIDEIKNRMNNLNACIIDEYECGALSAKEKIGLSKAYQIGASYFLKYGLYDNFDDLWNNHLEGLLFEYLRGTSGIEDKMKRLHNAYNDTTAH